MPVPKVIPINKMPKDIFKLVKAKKKFMERKGDFQCGFGQATILVIRDLINGKK